MFDHRPDAQTAAETLLEINNIEVIYNHVILVLTGVSLSVPKGGITALLGGNGAGKSTTLKSISGLLKSERGEITKGSVVYRGENLAGKDPADLVKTGVIQVMEGRHCFEHLTVEENLLTGSYTRTDGRGAIAADLDMVYEYFPRLKTRRKSQAGYTSGGEQQMVAIGRAMMARPETILLDEPSMGLAPQLVEQIFQIVHQHAGRIAGRIVRRSAFAMRPQVRHDQVEPGLCQRAGMAELDPVHLRAGKQPVDQHQRAAVRIGRIHAPHGELRAVARLDVVADEMDF